MIFVTEGGGSILMQSEADKFLSELEVMSKLCAQTRYTQCSYKDHMRGCWTLHPPAYYRASFYSYLTLFNFLSDDVITWPESYRNLDTLCAH